MHHASCIWMVGTTTCTSAPPVTPEEKWGKSPPGDHHRPTAPFNPRTSHSSRIFPLSPSPMKRHRLRLTFVRFVALKPVEMLLRRAECLLLPRYLLGTVSVFTHTTDGQILRLWAGNTPPCSAQQTLCPSKSNLFEGKGQLKSRYDDD